MTKEVVVLTGAGQIGMAIARRVGNGKKILIADWKIENANKIAKIIDRKSTRLNSSHVSESRMPSSA